MIILNVVGKIIIFLTIVDDENKIVRAFDEGAADYITKPFRLRELLARVKRTLNANSGVDKPEILSNGYGIGLPLALSIIRGQNGDIEMDGGGNQKGATFTIKFYK